MNKGVTVKFNRLFLLVLGFSQMVMATERVAYVRLTADEKDPTIFVADKNGQNPQELVKGAYPDISADGKLLTYIQGPEGQRIFDVMLTDLTTNETINLTNGKKAYYHPNISGNGRYLAFSAPIGEGDAAKNQIVIVDLKDLSKEWEIIKTDGAGFFPRLSSDGRFVIFHQTFEKTDFFSGKLKQVFMYDRLGRNPEKRLTAITNNNEYCYEPSLSFDDRQIAFVCRPSLDEADKEKTDVFTVQTFNLSEPRKVVTTDQRFNLAPSFTANGDIIYSANEGKLRKLFIAKKNSSSGYVILPFIGEEGFMFYSPSSTGDLQYVNTPQDLEMKDVRTSFAAVPLGEDGFMVVGGQVKGQHQHVAEAITGGTEVFRLDDQVHNDSIQPRPHAAEGFGAVKYGNKIYAFGGLTAEVRGDKDYSYSVDAIDEFDLNKKEWKTLKVKLNQPRSSHDVVIWKDKAYIIGGWNYDDDFANAQEGNRQGEGRYLDTIEVFDFKKQSISVLKTKIANPMRRAFDTVVTDQGIFLIGGMAGGDVGFLNKVTFFNPDTNEWKEYPPLSCGNFAPSAGYMNHSLYVFGGYCQYVPGSHSSVRLSNHIYKMDLTAQHPTWEHTGRYMRESRAFFQVLSDNNMFTILGGTSSSGPTEQATVNSIEQFGIRSN